MVKMSVFEWVIITLLIVGGLHWGVAGVLGLAVLTNLYNAGGVLTVIASIVSISIGLSALCMIYLLVKWNRVPTE